jgi:hypothetical protein
MLPSSTVYATAATLACLVGTQPPEKIKKLSDKSKKKPLRVKDIKTSRSFQRNKI